MTNKLLFLLSLAIAITLACTVGHYAEGQSRTVSINLVVVARSEITTQKQVELFLQGAARLKEVGVRIKVNRVLEVADELQANSLDLYWKRLFLWNDWAKRKRIHQRNVHTYFLLPPVWQNGTDYAAGAVGKICSIRSPERQFGASVIRLKNYRGEDRTQSSVDIVTHELLHLVGANHVDSRQNVMRSYYNPGEQPILALTKRQVGFCYGGKTPQGELIKSRKALACNGVWL